MQTAFVLKFAGAGTPELYETFFSHPKLKEAARSVRGRDAAVLGSYGSFPWTKAVRGICLLSLRAAAAAKLGKGAGGEVYILRGEGASIAASLDYAIDKEPNWLLDMFGIDLQGRALVRRLVHRSNPSRKRPGPVMLCFDPKRLRPNAISVFWEQKEVVDREHLLLMADLIDTEKCRSSIPASDSSGSEVLPERILRLGGRG